MERYGRSFRDSSSGSSNNTYINVREPWSYNHSYLGGGNPHTSDISWPPRSYTCSFCKREFRSAQALGGHMNVHRRDRARLRRSPPWDPPPPNRNPNPHPSLCPSRSTNPVPNLNSPPPSHATDTKVSSITYTFPSLFPPLARHSSPWSSTSCAEPFRDDLKAPSAVKSLFGVGEFEVLMEESASDELRKEREVVRLDLEIGMYERLKEELDLELRLGYT